MYVKGVDCRTRSFGCARSQGAHTLDERLFETHFNWAKERHRNIHGPYIQSENGASGSDERPRDVRLVGKGELSKDRMCDTINPK
jgi:hypothetical protein